LFFGYERLVLQGNAKGGWKCLVLPSQEDHTEKGNIVYHSLAEHFFL